MADRKYDDEDDESAPNRPKWIGWAIVIFMLMIAFGVANVGWLIMRPRPAAEAMQAVIDARPELAVGKSLVESSDCMRCHGIERNFVGPSFAAIADRYKSQPDAVDLLAGKIRNGGVGVWGDVIMPRHPQVSAEQSGGVAAWLIAVPATPPADTK